MIGSKKTIKESIKKSLAGAGYFLVAVAVFVCLWLIACKTVKNDYLFPPLGDIIRQIREVLQDKNFWSSFVATLLRALKAFGISFVFAIIFSVMAYLLPAFSRILTPLISFIRTLPTMAVLLIILVFTNPKMAPLVVAYLALFPMLYTAILSGLNTVDDKLTEMCKVYKVPIYKRIFQMYLPISSPYIARESAAALSFSLKLIVSAEIMANTFMSIGGMMQEAKIYYEMPKLFALTFIIVFTGFILEGLGILLSVALRERMK